MRAAAFIQARLGSKRLPGKVLLPLGKRPMLQVLIDRVRACPQIQSVIVSTSPAAEDDRLADFCQREGIPCSRHEVDDILGRLHASLSLAGDTDYLVRFWGDSPLVCPELISAGLIEVARTGASFFSTGIPALTFPSGLDFEIYCQKLIRKMHGECRDPFFREFPFEYVKANPEVKRAGLSHSQDLSGLELSVDYPEDLEIATRLFLALNGERKTFSFAEIQQYAAENPALFEKNTHLTRNLEYKQKLKLREK